MSRSATSCPRSTTTVSATTVVLGALATRDWRPMHHDKDFAVNRNGTQDIFLNTPNQAAWFERYLTDWTGPHGRLARVTFRMKGSVFPGDTMSLRGVVESTEVDEAGCGFVSVAVTLSVDGDVKTTCAARIALPRSADDNPWARGVTSGGRHRRVTSVQLPIRVHDLHALEQERESECWISISTRSRSCCARRCATSSGGIARSRWCAQMEDDPVGYPPALWAQLGELDLIGLLLPEEYGGSGMSLVEGVALYEELGRALAPTPHFVSAVMSGGVLAAAGSDAQKEQWLRPVASGEAILTPAWLEPENGFSPRGVEVRAEAEGSGFRLNGVKRHVAFAAAADRLVVLARTGEAPRPSTCSSSTRPRAG